MESEGLLVGSAEPEALIVRDNKKRGSSPQKSTSSNSNSVVGAKHVPHNAARNNKKGRRKLGRSKSVGGTAIPVRVAREEETGDENATTTTMGSSTTGTGRRRRRQRQTFPHEKFRGTLSGRSSSSNNGRANPNTTTTTAANISPEQQQQQQQPQPNFRSSRPSPPSGLVVSDEDNHQSEDGQKEDEDSIRDHEGPENFQDESEEKSRQSEEEEEEGTPLLLEATLVVADPLAQPQQQKQEQDQPLFPNHQRAILVDGVHAPPEQEESNNNNKFIWSHLIPQSAQDKCLCFGVVFSIVFLITAITVTAIVCGSGLCDGSSGDTTTTKEEGGGGNSPTTNSPTTTGLLRSSAPTPTGIPTTAVPTTSLNVIECDGSGNISSSNNNIFIHPDCGNIQSDSTLINATTVTPMTTTTTLAPTVIPEANASDSPSAQTTKIYQKTSSPSATPTTTTTGEVPTSDNNSTTVAPTTRTSLPTSVPSAQSNPDAATTTTSTVSPSAEVVVVDEIVDDDIDTLTPVPLGASNAVITVPQYTLEALKDETSPQSKALQWLSYDYTAAGPLEEIEEWRKHQLLGLATIYYSLKGDDWVEEDQQFWLKEDRPECDWTPYSLLSGWNPIRCNDEGRVDQLRFLPFNNTVIVGATLPREIELLSSLEMLDVQQFKAGLIGSLDDLFPLQLPALKTLDLFDNNLGGPPIPASLVDSLPMLTHLDLGKNPAFEGSIPTTVGLLTNLGSLSLFNNKLTGPLPSEIGRLTNLRSHLTLSNNQMMGTLPSQIGKLSILEGLFLFGNEFTGSIPPELG